MFYKVIKIIIIFICSIAFSISPAVTKSFAASKKKGQIPRIDAVSESNKKSNKITRTKAISKSSEKMVSKPSILTATLPEVSGNQYFHDMMKPILETHETIKSAQAGVRAAKEQIRIRLGARYPELELTLEAGHEDEYGETLPDQYNQSKLKLTQLLWDFGKTDATVEKARLQLAEQELNLEKVRQKLIVDAATAYQRLHRAYVVLQYSLESEANIRRQTGLEEIRVAEGFGYTTDVLQSKSQLAGAMSRRQRNEGEYGLAESGYLEIFGTLPDDVSKMKPLESYKMADVPQNLETVLEISKKNNLELLLARNKEAVTRTDIKSEKNKALFPDIEFALEGDVSDNYNATFGNKKEYKTSVVLKKKINLGLIENNKIKSARETMIKEKNVVADKQKMIEKTARSAWQRLKTAEQTTLTLTQQADLTAAFLKLAREERALGNRSLMDILAGETALINAKSDSFAAQIDISFGIFSLLEVMGNLDISMFNQHQ